MNDDPKLIVESVRYKELKRERRILSVRLTEDEVTKRGRTLAESYEALRQLDLEEKSFKDNLKSRRADIEMRQSELASAIRTGHEPREVECVEVADFSEGRAVLRREASFEVIDSRRLADLELVAADFFAPAHVAIYEAMLALGPGFDSVVLRARLTEPQRARLRAAEESAISAAGIETYSAIVTERALRRRLLETSERLRALALDRHTETPQAIDQAERALLALSARSVRSEPVPASVVITETLRVLQAIRDGAEPTGLQTGLHVLDARTSGLQRGELWVLAARPGCGKSALAFQIAWRAAIRGVVTLGFSLEMPLQQVGMRAFAAHVPMRNESLRHAERLTDYDFERITTTATELYSSAFWLADAAGATLADATSQARRLKRKRPELGLIVVDYLQIMGTPGRIESRTIGLAELTKGLKNLARELSVPVLLLSQLSRDVEKNKRKPMLSDLRECGAIENDADTVVFIHREPDVEPEGDGGRLACELIVGKQRNGPVGGFPVAFRTEWTRFEDAPAEPAPPEEPRR